MAAELTLQREGAGTRLSGRTEFCIGGTREAHTLCCFDLFLLRDSSIEAGETFLLSEAGSEILFMLLLILFYLFENFLILG